MKPTLDLVAGARPNSIKLAPVARALEAQRRFEPRIVRTGQHYDASILGRDRPRLPNGRPHGNATAYLASQSLHGVKFGLETTRALCEVLGHPERAFRTLLVAGTNGKGSVVAYLDSILRASGFRVGRYTSPHLERVNERIAVNGREITSRQLEWSVSRVKHAAESLLEKGSIASHPTFFETLTVAAFEHFRALRVEVAVLEVGMGGRLDSTNVSEPVASAIVTIAKDHEVFLGTTLSRIAREKAGVLRKGRPTILGKLPPEALRRIRSEGRRKGARLVLAAEDASFQETSGGLALQTPKRHYTGLKPLPGAHQRDNLLVAVRLLEEAGFRSRVREGVARTHWPGRLQRIPPFLLDGAHNPAGAQALAAYLESERPFVLLFGVMKDKDITGIVRALFPLAEGLVLTQPKVRRAATPALIVSRAGSLAPGAVLEPNVRRAITRAKKMARGHEIVVAGSLYLVGEVLTILRRSGS